MFRVIPILIWVVSTTVGAIESKPVPSLDTVSYDGEMVEFEYSTGGGYEDHIAEPSILVEKIRFEKASGLYFVDVRLQVVDTSPKPDSARGIVRVAGKAKVLDLVQIKMKSDKVLGKVIVESFKMPPLRGPTDLVEVK